MVIRTLVFVVLLVSTGQAASVPIIPWDPGMPDPLPNPGEAFEILPRHSDRPIGWSFYAKVPLVVTGVGWFDQFGDGLSHPHAISLWRDATGRTSWAYMGPGATNVFENVPIPSGTAAPLEGPWRTADLPVPITLPAGGYLLAGQDYVDSTDGIRQVLVNGPILLNLFPPDPRILYGAPWSPPGFLLALGAHLGPVLFVLAVPEPASMTLAWLAATALLFPRRRNSQRGAISYCAINGASHNTPCGDVEARAIKESLFLLPLRELRASVVSWFDELQSRLHGPQSQSSRHKRPTTNDQPLAPHPSLLTPRSSPLIPHPSFLTPHSSLLTPSTWPNFLVEIRPPLVLGLGRLPSVFLPSLTTNDSPRHRRVELSQFCIRCAT